MLSVHRLAQELLAVPNMENGSEPNQPLDPAKPEARPTSGLSHYQCQCIPFYNAAGGGFRHVQLRVLHDTFLKGANTYLPDVK